jgi:hypothetical protein
MQSGVVQAPHKAAETAPAKSSLTPCILDDDPAQLEMLAALVAIGLAACWIGLNY